MKDKPTIAVVARMDWHTAWILLPAMGRVLDNTLVVQDIESPVELREGLRRHVIEMVSYQGAEEVFVIGSTTTEDVQDIMDRVCSLRECSGFPVETPIHGLLFNPGNYKLEVVCRGYEEQSH